MSTLGSTRPIHVCIVTTVHPIDDVRVNNKIAHSFRRAGFRVTWVGPGHAYFDEKSYNRDGIQFVMAPPIKGRLGRLASGSRVAKLAAQVPEVDVYYAPDPDSAPIAVRLARRAGARSIFDIHEIYHGALLERWLFGMRIEPIREWVRKRIARVCTKCDLVMGVSDAVLAPVLADRSKGLIVRSCAPSWFAEGPPADVRGPGREGLRMMHGKGTQGYGTDSVLQALALAQGEAPGVQAVVMVTGGSDQDATSRDLRAKAAKLGVDGALVIQKGVPLQEMPGILRACDAGLIAYGRNLGVDILPNRIFEYLALGIPIIAPSYAVEIARIVEAEQCGVLVDFEDPGAIAGAMVRLAKDPALCRDMGRRGREGFLARHNLEVEVEPLLEKIRGWYPDRAGARC